MPHQSAVSFLTWRPPGCARCRRRRVAIVRTETLTTDPSKGPPRSPPVFVRIIPIRRIYKIGDLMRGSGQCVCRAPNRVRAVRPHRAECTGRLVHSRSSPESVATWTRAGPKPTARDGRTSSPFRSASSNIDLGEPGSNHLPAVSLDHKGSRGRSLLLGMVSNRVIWTSAGVGVGFGEPGFGGRRTTPTEPI